MGTAVAAWGIGDSIWSFTAASDPNPPFPPIADIGFLAVYPPAYIAIVLLVRSRTGSVRRKPVARRRDRWPHRRRGRTAVVFQAVVDALGGSPGGAPRVAVAS